MNFKDYIKIVQDWPIKGVEFKDITPLMADGKAFKLAVDEIIEYAKEREAEVIVGPEARGFIVGCPVAYALETGFAPVRKPNKLPREVIEVDYGLDFYAPQTTLAPDGRRIMIAWMQSWDRNIPSAQYGWAGSMTLPRELKVINNRIYQIPVKEIENYRHNEIPKPSYFS